MGNSLNSFKLDMDIAKIGTGDITISYIRHATCDMGDPRQGPQWRKPKPQCSQWQ